MNEVWILGATGRTGRMIAAKLVARQVPVGLVGRNAARLREVADEIGGAPRIVAVDPLDTVAGALAKHTPAVVVNTVGPFTTTAPMITRACPPGTHYLDLSNELPSVTALLGSHDEAVATGRTVVAGAGFGVLGTESVVLWLCAGMPAAQRVRVDSMARVDTVDGEVVGEALAASIVDTARSGGRRYEYGRVVRTRLGSDAARLTLPDGTTAQSAGAPLGELEAAHRASGAPFVVAGSSELPSGRAARVVLPVVRALLSVPPVARAARRRLARVFVPGNEKREYSWAHAEITWPDGGTREGWLRAGEGMDFTTSVSAEVAYRLAHGEGEPGAYTPGALFGYQLAEQVGGEFVGSRETAGSP
ncbi:saccharopine dehydrogenase NADP-binding domain-containing protein [Nocardia sp. BMG51109]|uniref:saccharopine dehydrogenase NADP-binding domain-containing protein n=1 Tax=Nocardia sp. BMG51109 TaxID=1056816 RepID=UPI00046314B7|nr:saccharopine dehydrogenase NADP-binding domain-containing protein [Nocardia sp. BMG51109]